MGEHAMKLALEALLMYSDGVGTRSKTNQAILALRQALGVQ